MILSATLILCVYYIVVDYSCDNCGWYHAALVGAMNMYTTYLCTLNFLYSV